MLVIIVCTEQVRRRVRRSGGGGLSKAKTDAGEGIKGNRVYLTSKIIKKNSEEGVVGHDFINEKKPLTIITSSVAYS